jgi:hypothetical protein
VARTTAFSCSTVDAPEAVLRGEGLGGEEPFARARRQEPRVAVAGEDHALQHIADGRRHGGASIRSKPRQAVGEERPREDHVALLVPSDEPEGLARDLVAALLEMTQAQVEVELVIEAAERGHESFQRHVGIERHLGEGMIARRAMASWPGVAW